MPVSLCLSFWTTALASSFLTASLLLSPLLPLRFIPPTTQVGQLALQTSCSAISAVCAAASTVNAVKVVCRGRTTGGLVLGMLINAMFTSHALVDSAVFLVPRLVECASLHLETVFLRSSGSGCFFCCKSCQALERNSRYAVSGEYCFGRQEAFRRSRTAGSATGACQAATPIPQTSLTGSLCHKLWLICSALAVSARRSVQVHLPLQTIYDPSLAPAPRANGSKNATTCHSPGY